MSYWFKKGKGGLIFEEELTTIFCYICFFSCLTPLHTHSATHRQNNMHVMSDPNLHHVVLTLQMVYCPCLIQILKIWEPNSHVEILDHWISRCDGKQTRDKSPAFLFRWWTTGLNYAMTSNTNPNIDKWSTDKIKQDMTSCYFSKTTEKLP